MKLQEYSDNEIREEFKARFKIGGEKQLNTASKVNDYLATLFAEYEQDVEHFVILFLNSQNRLIKSEKMFSGTINTAAVFPREIIKKVLEYNATDIILSHNHPSGETSPSSSDRAITKKIKTATESIDVNVLDHIIYGIDSYYSFADNRLL